MKLTIPKTPNFLKGLFPNYVWDIPSNNKDLYLSFDDGPTEKVTTWVLDMLDKYDAKATFFCLGKNINQHPTIFNDIIKRGHAVGNHTYNHCNGWATDLKEYLKEVDGCATEIQANSFLPSTDNPYIGPNKLFRPPYGKIKPNQGRELINLGYKIIMWDVLAYDWRKDVSGEKSLEYVLEGSKAGSIIVFHDSKKASQNMEYVLPKCLKHFTKLGYNFKALT